MTSVMSVNLTQYGLSDRVGDSMDGQTDRQTKGWSDRHTDQQTGRKAVRQTDRQSESCRWTNTPSTRRASVTTEPVSLLKSFSSEIIFLFTNKTI